MAVRNPVAEVNAVLCGNCAEVLREFPDNYFDACVTDPPYGLNEIKDLPGLLRAWLEGEEGWEWQTKGFMGKGWDKVPPPSIWKEVLRALKPGAYILCFAGCRTVDLMGISLRLAGFEDNNLLAWIFGSGFPKAVDVSKMIDKAAGAERKVLALNPNWRKTKSPIACPQQERPAYITAPATPEAKKWNGWKYGKQALKPAMEPILLMQKPFEKGLAGYQNVLKWGTGALNIEACRIPTKDTWKCSAASGYCGDGGWKAIPRESSPNGRFPANVLLDEEAARALDELAEEQSPFRFFYVAKASTRERNAGLDERNLHPTVKPIKLLRYLVCLITPPDGIVFDPFCGTGTTCIAAMLEGFRYVGVDIDPESCEIARKRIKYWALNPPALPEKTKPGEPQLL